MLIKGQEQQKPWKCNSSFKWVIGWMIVQKCYRWEEHIHSSKREWGVGGAEEGECLVACLGQCCCMVCPIEGNATPALTMKSYLFSFLIAIFHGKGPILTVSLPHPPWDCKIIETHSPPCPCQPVMQGLFGLNLTPSAWLKGESLIWLGAISHLLPVII